MLEASMASMDLDILLDLIDLCINNRNNIIRKEGFLCLLTLQKRFERKIPSDKLIKLMRVGKRDLDKEIVSIVGKIMEDLRDIDSKTWKMVIDE